LDRTGQRASAGFGPNGEPYIKVNQVRIFPNSATFFRSITKEIIFLERSRTQKKKKRNFERVRFFSRLDTSGIFASASWLGRGCLGLQPLFYPRFVAGKGWWFVLGLRKKGLNGGEADPGG
jgi:hypothetical protein